MKICKLHSTNWYILVWNTLLIGRSCSIIYVFYNNENCLYLQNGKVNFLWFFLQKTLLTITKRVAKIFFQFFFHFRQNIKAGSFNINSIYQVLFCHTPWNQSSPQFGEIQELSLAIFFLNNKVNNIIRIWSINNLPWSCYSSFLSWHFLSWHSIKKATLFYLFSSVWHSVALSFQSHDF